MGIFKLLFGHTARHTLVTTLAFIGYGVMVMGFMILASRILGPTQFGLVSVALALFTISFDILNFGTNSAIIRFVSVSLGKGNIKQANRYTQAIFRLRLIEAAGLIITAPLIALTLIRFVFHQPLLLWPAILALASGSGILLSEFGSALLQAHQSFIKSAIATLTVGSLKLILLGLVLITGRADIFWVTAAFVLTPVLSLPMYWVLIPKSFLSATRTHLVIKSLWQFSKWMALWGATATLSGRIDILFLGAMAPPIETGWYAVASKIATGFILIGSAMSTVFTPKVARIISDQRQIKRHFWLMATAAAALVLVVVFTNLTSPWFIPLIFGKGYLASIAIFKLLCLGMTLYLLSLPANVTLLALGHSKILGLLSGLQLVITAAVAWWLIPLRGGIGAAMSINLAFAISWVFSTAYAVRFIYQKHD